MVNSLLRTDPSASSLHLHARHYSVTPLGPRVGLIQWVPNTVSVFGVFRAWQAAAQDRHAALQAARVEAQGQGSGAATAADVPALPPIVTAKPMDLFFARLIPALKEVGMSTLTPRREWPLSVMRNVWSSLSSDMPRMLLARALWAGSGSAAAAWRRQQHYTR